MDFKEIESMDPSCKDGYKAIFKHLIPCHLKLDYDSTQSQYLQTNENIYFRILVQGEECRPEAIKLELTTDADVQLFYQCIVKQEDFMDVCFQNDLSVDFEGFIGMLKSLLQDCVNNPAIYQSVFTLENDDGCAIFRFYHNSEYRKSQIL